MEPTTINGIEYRIGKLGAFDQLHVARRLAPVLANVFTTLGAAGAIQLAEGEEFGDRLLMLASGPLSETLSKMTDDDVNYVVNRCVGVCERKQEKGYAKVMSGTTLMFHDIEGDTLVGLTIAVVQENLSRFFRTSQPE